MKSIKSAWRGVCRRARSVDLEFRDLAREFGSSLPESRASLHVVRNFLGQGVHSRVVMETLGHSQVSLTLDTYSHVLPGLRPEAAARMADAIGCQEKDGAQPQAQEPAGFIGKEVSRISRVGTSSTVGLLDSTASVGLRRCGSG